MDSKEYRLLQYFKKNIIAPTLLVAFTLGAYTTYGLYQPSTPKNKTTHTQKINKLEETTHNPSSDSNSVSASLNYLKK